MKKIIIILALALIALQGTAAGYSYTENDTTIGDWTNLTTALNPDYVTSASVNYSCDDITGIYSLGGNEYTKKKGVTIDNTAGGTLTGYQLPVTVGYDSDMQNDFDDIRFAYSNNTEISYYLDSKTDGVSADVFIKIDGAASSEFDINMYYGNSEVTTASNTNVFIQYHGSATSDYLDTLVHDSSNGFIYEGKVKSTAATHNLLWGVSNVLGSSDDFLTIQSYTENSKNENNFYSKDDGVSTQEIDSPAFTTNQWYDLKIVNSGTSATAYVDGSPIATAITTNLPDETLGLMMWSPTATSEQEFSFIRQYVANEPSVSFGSEQTATGTIEIKPKCYGGINGTTTILNETNSYGISTIDFTNIDYIKNIQHITTSASNINASIIINYNTSHAVLNSPANDSTYYQNQDTTMSWYSNPQGSSATYKVALDPNFYSIVEQGTTTSTSVLLSNLDFDTYYWKVSISGVDTETRVFNKVNQAPPGLFNFTAYNEETFSQINSYTVKLYNDSWFKEKSTTNGEVLYNSTEVAAGEYTALINSSGFNSRWYVVTSPANVSVYLPSSSSTVRLIDFNLMDYTNEFNYPDTRLIVTKTTENQGTITVSDRYFDASGSNPVYLLDYNNYILTLENTDGYQKSIGSYLPISNGEVSLVVGEIATIPDTSTHGGFNYNITKDNGAIVLKWNAPSGSLNSAFDYNITVGNTTVYEIESLAPYGTATYYMTSNDTHQIILYADTTGGIIDHQDYYRPQNQLVDLNISDFWYNLIGMFGLIVMGLLFSFRSAKTGAVLVAFCAVALSAIGMLHISTTVLSLAVVVALASKLSEDKKT